VLAFSATCAWVKRRVPSFCFIALSGRPSNVLSSSPARRTARA
jgi:hypothetical protein